MKDREKRLKYLIYLEAEKIRLAKIMIKQYKKELKKALEDKRVCYYNNKAYDIKILLNKNNTLTEFEK